MLKIKIDKKVDTIIRELSAELKALYPDFRGIYLFGSHARGLSGKDSDIDIAIILNKKLNSELKREIGRIVYNYDLKYNVFIDEYIFHNQDIIEPITPLRINVKSEGIYYDFS
ncbi:MAG: uncharacterized protein QG635_1221 [Bacteroidota bacterium]|nr:uncharacterized protein [Bacteroidota bacterium]